MCPLVVTSKNVSFVFLPSAISSKSRTSKHLELLRSILCPDIPVLTRKSSRPIFCTPLFPKTFTLHYSLLSVWTILMGFVTGMLGGKCCQNWTMKINVNYEYDFVFLTMLLIDMQSFFSKYLCIKTELALLTRAPLFNFRPIVTIAQLLP